MNLKDRALPALLFICGCLIAFQVLILATAPLSEKEAAIGLLVRHATEDGLPFEATAQGLPVSVSPAYPWLAALFCAGAKVNAFAIRLPALAALLALAGLAAIFTRRHAGTRAAVLAACFILSAYACIRMAGRAEMHLPGAFFTASAWLLWYEMAIVRRRWLAAWLASLAAATVSATFQGPAAFILFYLPLFFVKGHADIRRRIIHRDHIIAISTVTGITLAAHILLQALGPSPAHSYNILSGPLSHIDAPQLSGSYLVDLISFPLNSAFYLMPWTLIAWPAFCEAFHNVVPMQQRPLFQFLRALCLPIFIAFWLFPDSSPYSLLPLIVPLAVMAALHYDNLIRRHARALDRMLQLAAALAAAAIILAAVSALLWNLVSLQPRPLSIVFSIALNLAGVLCIILHFGGRLRLAHWIRLAAAAAILQGLMLAWIHHPAKIESGPSYAQHGRNIRKLLPSTATLYNYTGRRLDGLMFHTKRRVVFVPPSGPAVDLPDTIYVLAEHQAPLSIHHDAIRYRWEQLGQPILTSDGSSVVLWKGTDADSPAQQ